MKFIIFSLILLYASYIDIKKRIVPTHVHILLLLTGLLNVSLLSFAGYAIAFLPIFLVAVAKGGIGGGDVKLAGMCGFIMQGMNGLLGIMFGMVIAILIVPLKKLLKKEKINTPFALVPYLSIGCFLVTLFLKG